MRTIGSILVALLLVGPSAPALQEEAGFVPLFNGRDLSGWVNVNCAPETWSVREGMIYCTGRPICELRTDRMYENFVLELEYMHVVPGGNAGVFIWGDALTAPGQPFVRAIEIQVLDGHETANYTSHGDVFAIHGARMTPDRPHPAGWPRSLPSERRARPAGEWNHYRITADNGTVKLAVNGKEVSGGYDISPRKGYIHLESEGGIVWWRNLRIRELPSSGTLPPEHVAREDEGFRTLYTGTDFRGWRYPSGHEGHWVSKDWIIAYDGGSRAADQNLWTEEAFGDSAFIVDWRWTDKKPDGTTLPILLGETELPEEARTAIASALSSGSEAGRWHRARLETRGGRVSLTLNDAEVFRDVLVPGASAPARLGLRHGERPMQFANVFVRPL
jgi:hypothetical protein